MDLDRWKRELKIQFKKRLRLWIVLGHTFPILFTLADQYVKAQYWFKIEDLKGTQLTHEYIILFFLVSLIVSLLGEQLTR